MDEDVPDRSIPVELLFAAAPALAWNGETAGLVYQGLEPGADERLGFVPVDARGSPAGPERQIAAGRGLASSIPRIAADGEGFLVLFLEERETDVLVLLRLDAAGRELDRSETAISPGARDPTGPPVVLGDHVYVAFLPIGSDDLVRVLRLRGGPAFGAPETFVVPLGVAYRGGPHALSRFPRDEVLELAYVAEDGRLYRESFGADLERMSLPPGGLSLGGPPQDLASAPGDVPFLFALTPGETAGLAWLTLLHSVYGPHTDEVRARIVGPCLAVASADRPAWAAAFAVFEEDQWRVHLSAGAESTFGPFVRALLRVDHGASPGRIEDVPRPAVAWTGRGFLVVWDEWRSSAAAYGLYASHVALLEDP